MKTNYELVAGLETHVELSTRTKIFCACTTAFGGEPNTHCCPVCTGQPGALPRLNGEVVRYAILAGLALNCEIGEIAKMDRKNYVYPDLPKAYQISQYDKPLCYGGWVELSGGRRIGITRIHIEEDAGKLVHDGDDVYIDYNRGGVPLIEIVTEPDFRSIDEVREYVERLQLTMKYLGVSDCKMQEGSLRCDVNLSVRPAGADTFGTRTEIKNMNSFTFMSKAMTYEMERQIALLERGEAVEQETRRYDEATGTTQSMRGKEDAQDYRYFREPDLVTIRTTPEQVEALRRQLPELPDAKLRRYTDSLGLSQKDAWNLVRYRRVADYLDEAIAQGASARTAANFLTGQVFRRFPTEEQKEQFAPLLSAQRFAGLCRLVDGGTLRMNLAKGVLEKMLETGREAEAFLSPEDLAGVSEEDLRAVCQAAVDANPKAVADFRGGKEPALKALLGFVMKQTRGRADAGAAEKLLRELAR